MSVSWAHDDDILVYDICLFVTCLCVIPVEGLIRNIYVVVCFFSDIVVYIPRFLPFSLIVILLE
jgi:hypothetical protein